MKFNCNEIPISDEAFGCTLTLSEKKGIDTCSNKMTMDDHMSSCGRYVLLQRTYGEEDPESDYCYIETSDFDKSGEFKNYSIHLWRTLLLLRYESEVIEVGMAVNEPEYKKLKSIVLKITNKEGRLIGHQ
jgi:hypothetical protein